MAIVILALAVWFFFFRGTSYVSSLPADLQAVAQLDAHALQQKAVFSLTEQQQKELESSGIDFVHPLYAFVDGHDSPGLLLPLRSARKFEAYLRSKDIQVERQRGYRWAQGTQWLMVFSDDRCLVRGPLSEQEMGQMRGLMVNLMRQSGKGDNPLLQRITSSHAPVSASFSIGLVQHLLARFYPDASSVFHGEQTGTVGMDVDFQDQRIVADVTLYDTGLGAGKSFLVPLDKPATLLRSMEGDFVLSMGVNGDALLTLLRSYPVVRTAMLAINFTFDLDQMVRAIQGDVNLSVLTDTGGERQVALAAQFKDTRFRQSLSELTEDFYPLFEGGVEVVNDSTFSVGLSDGNLYTGLRGTRLVACTDQTYEESILADVEEGRYTSREDVVGSLIYAQLDLKKLQKGHGVQTYLASHGLDLIDLVKQYGTFVLRVKASEETTEKE